MKKTNLTSLLITLFLIGTLASCSWGRKKGEDELDSLQDESSATQAEAGTDAANETVSTAATSDQKPAVASTYTPPKTEAFEVEGTPGVWMNAYYYVRSKDETLASISQTLYGTPDREKDLATWNHRTQVSVGSLLYYSSPTRADDHAKVLSFAEDKGQAFEEVEVKAGESISKIAQNRFGDFRAWREIAALNPQVDPNRVAPGTKLKVAPGGTPAVVASTDATAQAPAVNTSAVPAAAPAAVVEPLAAANTQQPAPEMAAAAPAVPSVNSPVNAPVNSMDQAAAAPAGVDTAGNSEAVTAPKRGPASSKTKSTAEVEREPAEAEGWKAKLGPAYEMFQENPALAGAIGLLALGLIGLGVRRLRSS